MSTTPSPGPTPRVAQMRGLVLGLVVAVVLVFVRRTTVVEHIELDFVDMRTRAFAGSRGPDPRIVIAQVLEHDVAEVKNSALAQPWPWSLEINAAIFHLMAKAGVHAVVVDVLHFDKGAGPDDVASKTELSVPATQRRQLEASEAETYAGAMQAIGKVILAFSLSSDPKYELPLRKEHADTRLGTGKSPHAPPAGLTKAGVDLPVYRLIQGASRLGFANVDPDSDAVVRRIPLVGRWQERSVPSLAFAAALETDLHDTVAWTPTGLMLGQRTMPDGSFLVNFRGAALGTYPRVSPAAMLGWAMEEMSTGKVPAAAHEALRGKIVVWGVNLPGAEDVLTTPIGETTDGPVYQATALDNLLHADGRVHAPAWWNLVGLFVVALGLGALGGRVQRPWIVNLAAVGAAAMIVLVAVAAFEGGVSVDVFTPLLAVGLTWGGTSALRALTVGRYNRWLESTFGRYLAPSIIDAIRADPTLLALGGRRREITVFFSDLRGFTGISRGLEPTDLVRLLNHYLTESAAALHAHDGVIDKFIGDAVMAFFGDPLPQEDHAVRACRAALDTVARLPHLQGVVDELNLAGLEIGIGLNSGEAVIGNMGSDARQDYTCMGDTVNLASRIEGANKFFGSTILIGPDTYEAAKVEILAKPIAHLVVVGWDEPVAVYELVGMRDAPAPLHEHVDAFRRAHDAARAGDEAAAHEALDRALAARPGDGACAWLRGVVEAQEAQGPGTPWSGIVELTQK